MRDHYGVQARLRALVPTEGGAARQVNSELLTQNFFIQLWSGG